MSSLDGIARAQGAMGALSAAMATIVAGAAEAEQRAADKDELLHDKDRRIRELERRLHDAERAATEYRRDLYRRGYATGYRTAKNGKPEDADAALDHGHNKTMERDGLLMAVA